MSNISIYNTSKPLTVALVGNPNCGKTTLFNLLTGSDQKVGNWPGVTVERKTGVCKAEPRLQLVDTPGCYSLVPFTPEESVTANYLRQGKPDVVLNIADCTHLERSLLLTTQLAELHLPMVVALNMADEARAQGIQVDAAQLQSAFGCAFVSISAAKNEGISALMAACLHAQEHTPTLHAGQTEQRYRFIEQTLEKAVRRTPRKADITDRTDKLLLNKWLAFPILALVMAAVFYLSVEGPGGWAAHCLQRLTPLLQAEASRLVQPLNAPWLQSLLAEGVVGGVMSVVCFVPQVMMLYGCIALLEACGYMARIAFVTDRLLRGLGLGGRSFVCMILGCGCSVPAIVATRTIKNTAERQCTVMLAPFVPCSAKLAVIAFFCSNVFGGGALVAVTLYMASIVAVILCGLLLKALRRDKTDGGFVMELPPYRLPRAQNVLRQMWQRGKSFLVRAGTVILASSVVLWALTNLNFRLALTDAEHSMLADIGRIVSPLFAPLGFDDRGGGWQLAVATLSGLAAKETVIATLQILLPAGVSSAVSAAGAYSFVVYNLFTVPCVAACSAGFSELGSKKLGIAGMGLQISAAYLLAFVSYRIGLLVT